MILIITESGDVSSSRVIDWLRYYSIPFVRINQEELNLFVSARIDAVGVFAEFLLNNRRILLEDIDVIWYRRGLLRFKFELIKSGNGPFDEYINKYLQEEISTITDFVKYLFRKRRILGYNLSYEINKLIVLNEANNCGLTTPETSIITKFTHAYSQDIGDNITKGISEAINFNLMGSGHVMNYTSKATIGDGRERTFPSLLQNYISKRYELRIFFIKGNFYAMAIFSQQSSKTSLDFRNYDFDSPNRTVPYTLPDDIRMKLCKLMDRLAIDTGSIDMIVDESGRFVFLEVNPVGQYGMVSHPCNYEIDQKIALHLMSELSRNS